MLAMLALCGRQWPYAMAKGAMRKSPVGRPEASSALQFNFVAGIPKDEAGQVWKAMREARVRSLYFGEMAGRYSQRQQWVQGLSWGFAAAALVALVGDPLPRVGALCAAVAASANIWAAATNLHHTHATLVMLKTAWEDLRLEYGEVWSNWHEDDAAARFTALQRRANDLGVIASPGSP